MDGKWMNEHECEKDYGWHVKIKYMEELWDYVGQLMRKGYGKCIWMDERKVKVKIKDGKRIINGKMEAWKVCMEVWYG